jgi:hypothetical protein
MAKVNCLYSGDGGGGGGQQALLLLHWAGPDILSEYGSGSGSGSCTYIYI